MSATIAIAPARTSLLVPGYVATMLFSACLLFLVQPMFARMALPLLGGTPAVWAIAMCFFQAVLMGGYAYAHILRKFVAPRTAVFLHFVLMALGWFSLPVSIAPAEVPAGGATAGIWLIGLMARNIGYPFFFLSATAPLLQSWFARTTHPSAFNPYFLYSASNIGSIGALILYPFIVEPLLGLHSQSLLWSVGYGMLTVAIGLCGLLMLSNFKPLVVGWDITPSLGIPVKQRLWWVFMAFVPSALLVAWTNHITTDIASAPFLWLPPLILFLLTFVLVFRDQSLISLRVARIMQLASLPIAFAVQMALPLNLSIWVILAGAVSFFSTAVICHRQLYEARPDAGKLTEFYLLMSLGGVLGGLFVSLIAPLIFSSVAEYPILLLLGVAAHGELFNDVKIRAQLRNPLLLVTIFVALVGLFNLLGGGEQHFRVTTLSIEMAFLAAAAFLFIRAGRYGLLVIAVLVLTLTKLLTPLQERVAYRSYFGVLSVVEGVQNDFRGLIHGTTMHGAERLDELTEGFKDHPHALTYYSPQGGMARTLLARQRELAQLGQNGIYRIVGLGTGSLACYSKPGEDWAYYEIDRDVIKVAQDPNQFNFLSNCAPQMEMIEGDARITLAHAPPQKADYFLVDAFSSDSIPIHLMTTEALKLYLSQLNDDGVLVMHVTNRYLDLVPVVAANLQAVDPTMGSRILDFAPEKIDLAATHSIAIVMSKNAKLLTELDQDGGTQPLVASPGIDSWSDDFSNLPAAILRRLTIRKY